MTGCSSTIQTYGAFQEGFIATQKRVMQYSDEKVITNTRLKNVYNPLLHEGAIYLEEMKQAAYKGDSDTVSIIGAKLSIVVAKIEKELNNESRNPVDPDGFGSGTSKTIETSP